MFCLQLNGAQHRAERAVQEQKRKHAGENVAATPLPLFCCPRRHRHGLTHTGPRVRKPLTKEDMNAGQVWVLRRLDYIMTLNSSKAQSCDRVACFFMIIKHQFVLGHLWTEVKYLFIIFKAFLKMVQAI